MMNYWKIKCIGLFLLITVCGCKNKETVNLPIPSPQQLAWQDMELTMFVHFGPATWQDQEYDDLSTPLSGINPSRLDTDQWAQVAASYGAKIIIFCAKHTGGFAWWQTQTTDYGIKETPWKGGEGDVLADLAASCEKYGLKLGVYLSPEDKFLHVGMGGKALDPDFQISYERIYRQQLKELLTRYGDVYEIWVDGSLVFNIGDIIDEYAPEAVILQSSSATIRWVGNEMGFAPYPAWNTVRKADARSGNSTAAHSDPNGDVWLPIEVDVSIRRPHWFWKTWNEESLLPVEELMKIYYCSVGRGCVFLVNACPDTTGSIPPAEALRFAEFGREIQERFSQPVKEKAGKGNSFLLSFETPQKIDNILLMEDISLGERVRSFIIEGKQNNEWNTLFEGFAIGHKLICQIPAASYDAIRLKVINSVATPHIRRFAAFNTGKPALELPVVKESWNLRNVGEWDIEKEQQHTMSFRLDLTSYCTAAEPYEVAFVVRSEKCVEPVFSYDWANTGQWEDNIPLSQMLHVSDVHLWFAGIEANHYLYSNEHKPNRVLFNLTGIPSELMIDTQISIPPSLKGAKIEAYLLRK